ncbi:MAG TPA: hypothetical protein VK797_24735 [Tepidisphaeraceae bacterium]|jgi:hypothetical protein|nr:hypothetical protein [Tepidisphaeraceae bacterium]
MNTATSARPRRRSSRCSFNPEPLESRTLLSAWGTIDNYQLATGWNAGAAAMAMDSAGNVYAAGYAQDSSGRTHGIVREKLAGSANWSTIEDYISGTLATFKAIAIDGAGDVYVGGGAKDSSGNEQWIVLEKPASSGSFSVVDSYATSGGSDVAGLAIDASGNVYAAGQTVVTTGGKKPTTTYCWTVRKQTGGQGAFGTVDNSISSTSPTAAAFGATSIPNGASAGLYIVGQAAGGNWVVRKSSNAGATWTTVDSFLYNPSVNGDTATAVTGDGAGNLYVVGHGNSSTSTHWLVRESSNGGSSWSTVDDFQDGGSSNGAFAVGTDLAGNVYVVGSGKDSSGGYHDLIRSNAGGSWATVSDLATTVASSAAGFAVDPSGNLYSATRAADSTPVDHWIVQSTTGPSAPVTAATSSASAAAVFSSTLVSGSGDPTDLPFHRRHHHG